MNGSKAPALFRYDDQTAVRVVTVDGEPWFVLADLLALRSHPLGVDSSFPGPDPRFADQ